MIIFAGGQIGNRADATAAPLEVSDADARAAGWRDFRDGLTPPEQAFFQPPNGRGELELSDAGRNSMQGAASRNVHLHVLLLGRAVENPDRRLFVMPMPVYQVMPPAFQWVTTIALGTHGNRGFRITINGYGDFPVEWVDLRTALGRTHRGNTAHASDACVYGTRFQGELEPRLAAQWQRLSQRRSMVGVRPGDTAERWFDREDTVTLFHELLVHVIMGQGHGGNWDEIVEARARRTWMANQP